MDEAFADAGHKAVQGGRIMSEAYWPPGRTTIIEDLGNVIATDCQIYAYGTLCHQQGSPSRSEPAPQAQSGVSFVAARPF
jgi:hypothetical protein